MRWSRVFLQLDPPGVDLYQLAVDYRPGRTYQEIWNSAVLSPAFGNRSADDLQGILRTPEGQIFVNDGLLVDPVPGRTSGGILDNGRTALYRDGELVAEEALYGWLRTDVPPQEATYRLEATLDRARYADVSTKVSVAWTFRSRHEATTRPVALPLLGIRYAPTLDAGRTAPAGRPFSIPIRVEHQPGSTGCTVTGLTVHASYDDGATWSPARVTRSGGTWTAAVTHPAGAGHVSLRATATDSRGGRVEQTIIRAYLLG